MDAATTPDSTASMVPPEATTDLKSLLTAELIGYTNLSEILDQEKRLLIERNFDAFAETLEKKHQLVHQLGQLSSHRVNVLGALKLEPNENGVLELIERQPEFGRELLVQNWQAIKALVQKCNQQNEVNAKVAHRAQATSKQILNILKGAPLSESLYDKSGSSEGAGSGLTITSA